MQTAGRPKLVLLALLFVLLPAGRAAESSSVQSKVIEIEWAAELSREIGWFEPETGKIVRDRIVRRFSLICSGFCYLNIVSFPARNCMEIGELGRRARALLEASQAGSDVDFFEVAKNGSGDFSVIQQGEDAILVEFTSHEPHRSKNSLLVSYRSRFGPGSGNKVPVKVTGVESGIGSGKSLFVGGDEVVKFEYRQLPPSIVCLVNIQSRAPSSR